MANHNARLMGQSEIIYSDGAAVWRRLQCHQNQFEFGDLLPGGPHYSMLIKVWFLFVRDAKKITWYSILFWTRLGCGCFFWKKTNIRTNWALLYTFDIVHQERRGGVFRSFVHRPRLLTGWLHHNHRQCLAVSLFYRRRLRSLLLCSTDQTTAVCILTGWPCLR